MKLACNYLLETEELVREGQINIDCFKFPALGFQMGIMENINEFSSFCARLLKLKPILLHSLYPSPHDLSSPTLLRDFDYETAVQLLSATNTPGISLHPCLPPLDNSKTTAELTDIIINNAGTLREQFSDMEFFSIENLDGARYGELLSPEVMSDIIHGSGCDFLLDISHAAHAAHIRGEEIHDYLRRLPLERTYEIHLNGWVRSGNSFMSHIKAHDESYALLEYVLGYCKPEIITLEYGRGNDKAGVGIPLVSSDSINEAAKEEITEQLDRLSLIVKNPVTA